MTANFNLSSDIICAFARAKESEQLQTGCKVMGQILENSEIARKEHIAMCQDTGMAVVFVEVGQNVRLEGGAIKMRSTRASGEDTGTRIYAVQWSMTIS